MVLVPQEAEPFQTGSHLPLEQVVVLVRGYFRISEPHLLVVPQELGLRTLGLRASMSLAWTHLCLMAAVLPEQASNQK